MKTATTAGDATAYAYTQNGQIASIDGPRTDAIDVTSFLYDAKGNLTKGRRGGRS